jgi:hypothetical protein
MAHDNVVAACVNVTHDAAIMRVRIFSTVSAMKTGSTKDKGYEVEVIYNGEMAFAKGGAGTYRFQHNNHVLQFAASQFASGNKALGRWLTRLLAEAEPDLFWEDSTHPVTKIKEIQAALERDDGSAKDFLKAQNEAWSTNLIQYGPQKGKGAESNPNKK